MRTVWLILAIACTTADSGGGADDGATTPPPTGSGECREDANCAGYYCFAPGEPNCPVEQSCYGGTFCATNETCLGADPAFDSCADSVCRPNCDGDGDCRAGAETCEGEICTPIACDAGFSCEDHETCVPGAALHGCVRDACAGDSECGGGFCVKGACYAEPGACGMLAEN